MTPVLESLKRSVASAEFLIASRIVQKAAEILAEEALDASDSARYLFAADRIAAVLDSTEPTRQRLLLCSPALVENSGRVRTLIEMIEAEPDDEAARLRLAKLLFRALIWRPETFPDPDSPRTH